MESSFGWAGSILHIDLTNRKIDQSRTLDYTERFLGGLGIGQKLFWDLARPGQEAFDPASPLIFMTGPLTGTTAPGASRMVVCGKSPCIYPETFVSGSLGGNFPTALKRAGFDGAVITGQADAPVYLHLKDGAAQIRDAADLWGLKNSRVQTALAEKIGGNWSFLSIGPAGESRSRIGNIASDLESSVSMGFGSVMGSKRLKAVVASGQGPIPSAHPDRIRAIRKKLRAMRGEGFFNLFGKPAGVGGAEVVRKVHCVGCPEGCWRTLQRIPSGEEGVRKCQMGLFYALWDMKKNSGKITETSFKAVTVANDFGVCLLEMIYLFMWLDRCFEERILTEAEVGLPMAELGSLAFLEQFLEKLCAREGFGALLAEGAIRASIAAGERSREVTLNQLTQSGRGVAYGPKVFHQTALIYATEPRPAVTELHGICEPLTKWARWHLSGGKDTYVSTEVLRKIGARFWGGEAAVDFSRTDGMARAAVKVQNRETIKESLILCDFLFPAYDDAAKADHVGDPTLERQLLEAVLGAEISEAKLDRYAERIFALARAIQLREGRNGRADDTLPEFFFFEREEMIPDVFGMHNRELLLPGAGEAVISRKGKAVDREAFEKMKDAYYDLRGWDRETGFFRRETLDALGLADVAGQIEGRVV